MRIQFKSRHGMQNVIVPFIADPDLNRWYDGQVREIDVARTVRFRPREGSTVLKSVPAIDALFSSGPEFVDADTGLNPDFVCKVCGTETHDEFFLRMGETMVPYEDDDGNRLCVRHFLATHPSDIDWHALVGVDPEIIASARAASAAVQARAVSPQGQPTSTAPLTVRPTITPASVVLAADNAAS